MTVDTMPEPPSLKAQASTQMASSDPISLTVQSSTTLTSARLTVAVSPPSTPLPFQRLDLMDNHTIPMATTTVMPTTSQENGAQSSILWRLTSSPGELLHTPAMEMALTITTATEVVRTPLISSRKEPSDLEEKSTHMSLSTLRSNLARHLTSSL